jgi:hypothetical protein
MPQLGPRRHRGVVGRISLVALVDHERASLEKRRSRRATAACDNFAGGVQQPFAWRRQASAAARSRKQTPELTLIWRGRVNSGTGCRRLRVSDRLGSAVPAYWRRPPQ